MCQIYLYVYVVSSMFTANINLVKMPTLALFTANPSRNHLVAGLQSSWGSHGEACTRLRHGPQEPTTKLPFQAEIMIQG